MQVQESKRGAVLVVAAEGRLDGSTADAFQDRLSAAVERGETDILLDFSDLAYISSAGLRILLVTAKRLKEGNGQFAVCGLTDSVTSVFNVSGFNTIIRIFPDQAAALASFS